MTKIGPAAAAAAVLLICGGCGSSVPAPAADETIRIGRGDTLDGLLARAGLDSATRLGMPAALRSRFDLRKLRDGAELLLVRSAAGAVESLEYLIDPDHELQLLQTAGVFSAARTVPVCATLR